MSSIIPKLSLIMSFKWWPTQSRTFGGLGLGWLIILVIHFKSWHDDGETADDDGGLHLLLPQISLVPHFVFGCLRLALVAIGFELLFAV